MSFLLTYLQFHKQRVRAIGLVLGCLLLVFLAQSFSLTPAGITLLGDLHAALPVAATAPADTITVPAVRPAESILQADSQARGVTADLSPSATHQEPLLAALNCAREQAGQPELTHNPQLSAEAAAIWQELVRNPNNTLTALASGKYTQAAILPLTLAEAPAVPGTESEQDMPDDQPEGLCVMGGIDLTQLDLTGASTVGIAVFADPQPEDGLDDSSAVVIAQ